MQVAIYARISIASEESVSIERQVQAAQQYAAARGWDVAEVFTDEGVSASANRPEDRAGWSALLASPERFEAVIIWKVDRLARRVLDFLHADAALKERGAGIVAVDDPIDMTTAQGRAFATMLAVFGEMEAEAIRARVTAARRHLLHNGRHPGGTVPYGWRTYRNPDGAGYVLRQDPDRIDYVKGMVERVQRGNSIYSVVQWLDEVGAPLPTASQSARKGTGWSYTTVERLIRNPVLAGMTQYNPGTNDRDADRGKARPIDFVRDADGLPVVDDAVAVMPASAWRAMVAALDADDTGRATPRALRSKTSALLSGLVRCGACLDNGNGDVRMWRGTTQGRESYSCPKCHQTVSRIEAHVIEQFLLTKGERTRWTPVTEVVVDGTVELPEIEHRLRELEALINDAPDRAERRRLREQQDDLLDRRDATRLATPRTELRYAPAGTYGDAWAAAGDDVAERRAVLDDALESIEVRRGRTGRGLDTGRLTFSWRFPDEVGPEEVPADEELSAWADDNPATQ